MKSLIKILVLIMGTTSCATPKYPYPHYFYNRESDVLVGRTALDDRPADICAPNSEHYYSCVVYRVREHERLKADYLRILVEVNELNRKLKSCK